MIPVELGELGGRSHRLTVEQGRALAASGIVDARPSVLEPGVWTVSALDKVGVARVADMEVWIAPKLAIGRLMFLLGYAADPAGWRDELAHFATGDGLVPAMAHALWRLTERAVRPGLLQGYRTVEETSYVLRGRLREADQLRRHYGQVVPMELRHDDFTVDIPENRILLAAVSRMLTVPGVDEVCRRKLSALRARLAEVTSLVRGSALPPWQPNRLNQRYVPALRMAELVWRATSTEYARGEVLATGFLFDVAKVFEDFVTVAVSEALHIGHGGRAYAQFPCHLDEAMSVLMKPDLVWSSGGRPAGVLDAKYKAKTPNADLYQLLAYCTTLGLTRGHLVYAKGNDVPMVHRVKQAGVEIVAHALDLTLPPSELLAQVKRLAEAVAADG